MPPDITPVIPVSMAGEKKWKKTFCRKKKRPLDKKWLTWGDTQTQSVPTETWVGTADLLVFVVPQKHLWLHWEKITQGNIDIHSSFIANVFNGIINHKTKRKTHWKIILRPYRKGLRNTWARSFHSNHKDQYSWYNGTIQWYNTTLLILNFNAWHESITKEWTVTLGCKLHYLRYTEVQLE